MEVLLFENQVEGFAEVGDVGGVGSEIGFQVFGALFQDTAEGVVEFFREKLREALKLTRTLADIRFVELVPCFLFEEVKQSLHLI